MKPDDFAFLVRLLGRRSGLSLTIAKEVHVARRLEPVIRLFGLRDMDGLLHQLRLGHEALAGAVTEAMTVNETCFFRDGDLFARLENTVMPHLVATRQQHKRLRIWSAAAAAGQEAYSIAMILAGMGLAARGWSIDIVATDLSADAVARAEQGLYTPHELQRGLTPQLRAAWFRAEDKDWRISETLRRMVRFRQFNLMDSYGWLDELDLVLCRNVLIYFDSATRLSVLDRMADTLAPGGILVVGNTESAALPPAFTEAHGGDGIYAIRPQPPVRLVG